MSRGGKGIKFEGLRGLQHHTCNTVAISDQDSSVEGIRDTRLLRQQQNIYVRDARR